MSEKSTPTKAEASKSRDVRNFDGFKANSSQNYSTYQDSYKNSRGNYRSQSGQRGRGGKHTNYQSRHDDFYEGQNNRYTNQRDEVCKSKASSSVYCAAESVYEILNKEKNGTPLRDRSIDNRNPRSHDQYRDQQRDRPNDYRNPRSHNQNSGQQSDKPNNYRKPITYNNQDKKGNFNKYPNDTKEKSFDGPRYKKIKYPMGVNGPDNTGPSLKRPPKKVGGSNHAFKDHKFNKQRSLLNEISNVLVQVKSFPELFSYDDMCEELLKENPIDNSVKISENKLECTEKPKRAPFLKNGVIIRNDRGQGNIPNEFKRRRKPGRLTLLNRVRKGIPLHSDEDDDEYIEIRKKKKTGEEKKKKILDIIAKCRESQDRKRDKNKTKQRTEKENLSSSSEDLDEDYRNQRKSDAHKLSDNLGSDIANFISKKSTTPKDLCLLDVKNIVQSRSGSNNNTTMAEECSILSYKKDLPNQMKRLDINNTGTFAKKDNGTMTKKCDKILSNEGSLCEQNVPNANNAIIVANKSSFEEEQQNACSSSIIGESVENKTDVYSEPANNQHEITLENTEKVFSHSEEPSEISQPVYVNVVKVNRNSEIPISMKDTENNIEKFREAEKKSKIKEKTEEVEGFISKKGDVDLKNKQEVDVKSVEEILVNHTKFIDVKSSMEVDEKNAVEFLKEDDDKNSEDIHVKISTEVNTINSEEIDINSAQEVVEKESVEIEMENVDEDDERYVEEENPEDQVEDEEETEEDESEASDSSVDSIKIKLLKSLTKQLISEGKEANSKQVIELLQEKLKNLSLKEVQASSNSCTKESKHPARQSEPKDFDSHETAEKSFIKEEIFLVSERAVDSNVIMVSDDSTDDDEYDEDDGEDDDFPVSIVKS